MNKVITPVDIDARQKLGIRPGDTIVVTQKIVEGDKTRLQDFEGLVLAVKHGHEAGASFTVRRVASGVGVEKIFPLYSPMIESVKILRKGQTRRAKLYFVREKAAREIRRTMKSVIAKRATPVETKEAVIEEAAETPAK